MPLGRTWIALGLLLAAPIIPAQCLLAQDVAAPTNPPASASAKPHHKTRKTLKPLVLPPMPSGPLRQLPMEQIPATPAKVSYENGLLTIAAQNSNLGEILREVRKLTGAAIEIPPGSAANERVVAHLGPGAPRDVLSGLLNGSSFNYVVVGSMTDPTAISSVILTQKASAAGETQTAAVNQNDSPNVYQNNPPPMQPMHPSRFPQPGMMNQQNLMNPGTPPGVATPTADDDDTKDDDDKDDDDAETPAVAQPATPDPNTQQVVDPEQPNAGPKTPEQIMDMLRRQQQPGALPQQQNPPPQQ
jgi:hypothetical protein